MLADPVGPREQHPVGRGLGPRHGVLDPRDAGAGARPGVVRPPGEGGRPLLADAGGEVQNRRLQRLTVDLREARRRAVQRDAPLPRHGGQLLVVPDPEEGRAVRHARGADVRRERGVHHGRLVHDDQTAVPEPLAVPEHEDLLLPPVLTLLHGGVERTVDGAGVRSHDLGQAASRLARGGEQGHVPAPLRQHGAHEGGLPRPRRAGQHGLAVGAAQGGEERREGGGLVGGEGDLGLGEGRHGDLACALRRGVGWVGGSPVPRRAQPLYPRPVAPSRCAG